MPLEFRCSQCNQLLRVPDTAAGKQARCPKCQAQMAVPAAAGEIVAATVESTSVGGPAAFSQTQFPEPVVAPPIPPAGNPFAGETPITMRQPGAFSDSPASLNPYASPASAGQGYAADFNYFGPRTGLPWENEPRTLGCFFRTMSAVLASPTRAFSIMRREGGLGIPLLFNLYAVGTVLAIVMVFLVPILALVTVFDQEKNDVAEMAGIAGFVAILGLMYLLLLVVIVPLVSAAAMHVSLLMIGGAKQGFETTFRVMCYGYYSALLPATFLNIVPYLGGMASMVWIVVILVYGLARGHEISGGKATAAVLLPLFLCCGGFIGLAIAVNVWS